MKENQAINVHRFREIVRLVQQCNLKYLSSDGHLHAVIGGIGLPVWTIILRISSGLMF